MAVNHNSAELWFDPLCPWAWMTSRWILEVEKVRDVQVTFRPMSLMILNDRDASEPGWLPARVAAGIEQEFDAAKVGEYYTAVGGQIHLHQNKDYPVAVAKALDEVGLPADLIERANAGDFDDTLRTSHDSGISQVGQDVGTPIISVNGTAFFGPVISPAPKGEDAGKLWDGCLLVAGTPGFFEIKRTRTVGPIFD